MRVLIRLLPVVVLLTACAAPPPKPAATPATDPDAVAAQMLRTGEYHAAARIYMELAAKSVGALRERYRLAAVDALLRAGLERQAAGLLVETAPPGVPPELAMQRQLLTAELALPEDPDRALSLLLQPSASPGAAALHDRYHLLRARAFSSLGNHLEAAREYIEREPFLDSTDAVEANQLATWEALSYLSNEALTRLRIHPPPNILSGWMELAEIAKDMDQTGAQVTARIDAWRDRYPTHPVLPAFLRTLEKRSRELLNRPSRIAVLLPFSGPFAQAGEAIRDGILAAYYQGSRNSEITLVFYDEADPAGVLSMYEKAVADGAGFVIGPLDKESVRLLTLQPELAVPVLALNYANPTSGDSLYQFGLTPEEEASQVAELAWLDGHDNAAILAPDGTWGDRLAEAFSARWEALGGQVVSSVRYDPQKNDFSRPLKHLLNIDQSEARRAAVADTLRNAVKFEPRRRQDVDFVFLGAFPVQARLIRPQLRFHRAIGMPVYGTSHLYGGHPDATHDRDMDGVIFGDMPWTLDMDTPYTAVREDAKAQLKHHAGALQRLVALGVDAYHIVPRLKLLARYPHDRFQGETGTLRVGEGNRVRRHLSWAHFVRGEPRQLEAGELLLSNDTEDGH